VAPDAVRSAYRSLCHEEITMKKFEKFESEHKTFNRQTDIITTGNVLADTLLGWYIRPVNETKCNGYDFTPGDLQKADLKFFYHVPEVVRQYINYKGKQQKMILYELRHWNGKRKTVHGYIITDDKHEFLNCFVIQHGHKSSSIIEEAIKYLAN